MPIIDNNKPKTYEIETANPPRISFLVGDGPTAGSLLNHFHMMLGAPEAFIRCEGFSLHIEKGSSVSETLSVALADIDSPGSDFTYDLSYDELQLARFHVPHLFKTLNK